MPLKPRVFDPPKAAFLIEPLRRDVLDFRLCDDAFEAAHAGVVDNENKKGPADPLALGFLCDEEFGEKEKAGKQRLRSGAVADDLPRLCVLGKYLALVLFLEERFQLLEILIGKRKLQASVPGFLALKMIELAWIKNASEEYGFVHNEQ